MLQEEIRAHKERLTQLAKTLRDTPQDGNTFHYCVPELWSEYDGTNKTGSQIYRSFTDGELLNMLKDAARSIGRAPRQNEIYCVYRQYIRLRFGNWPRALEAAGLRIPKRLRTKQ